MTILALIVAYKAAIASKQAAAHEAREAKRFEYSSSALLGLEGNLTALHKTVTKKLLPDVHAVYEHVLTGGEDIRATGLTTLLTRAGYKDVIALSPDNLLVFMGIQHDSLRISFLVSFDQFSDLTVSSFAYYVLNYDVAAATRLLQLNAENKIGAVGTRVAADKKLITVTHSMHLPSGRIGADALNHIILRLAVVHSMARRVFDQRQVERHEILFKEFAELEFEAPAEIADTIQAALAEMTHPVS